MNVLKSACVRIRGRRGGWYWVGGRRGLASSFQCECEGERARRERGGEERRKVPRRGRAAGERSEHDAKRSNAEREVEDL